jgi:glycosyltransferase involved in cell wall biosynthesis
VDDASGDDTLLRLHELSVQHKTWITVLSLPENQGAASARNAGWALATQDFIAFLDADDAWHPDKIRLQYNFMVRNPDIVLTGHEIIDARTATRDSEPVSVNPLIQRIGRIDLLIRNRFSTPTVMVRRDINLRFTEGKRYSEDYDLWLQIVFSGLSAVVIQVPLAYIFKAFYGESGLSSQLWKMEKGELDSFLHLYRTKRINELEILAVSIFSLMKFFRRLSIILLRPQRLARH